MQVILAAPAHPAQRDAYAVVCPEHPLRLGQEERAAECRSRAGEKLAPVYVRFAFHVFLPFTIVMLPLSWPVSAMEIRRAARFAVHRAIVIDPSRRLH